MLKMTKGFFYKAVLYIIAAVLIVSCSTAFLGLIIALLVVHGQPAQDLIRLLKIHPRVPILLNFGAILSLITWPIYIVAGINLLRLRSWARRLLVWFIPMMIVLDVIYSYLIDMLHVNTHIHILVNFLIWMILLTNGIKGLFKTTDKQLPVA